METQRGKEIVFEEQNFDGFLNKLKEYSDIECLGEVIEHSWGQRVIRFYDLDGHIIDVGEDMKMVIKRFLDSGITIEEISEKMDKSGIRQVSWKTAKLSVNMVWKYLWKIREKNIPA